MKNAVKRVVALGALLTLAGTFLPLAEESSGLGVPKALKLGTSLWAAARVEGLAVLSYAVLGLVLVAALCAGLGLRRRSGRGLALGTLLASVTPTLLASSWALQSLRQNGPGAGLLLLTLGGWLLVSGSILALRRGEEAQRRPRATWSSESSRTYE